MVDPAKVDPGRSPPKVDPAKVMMDQNKSNPEEKLRRLIISSFSMWPFAFLVLVILPFMASGAKMKMVMGGGRVIRI